MKYFTTDGILWSMCHWFKIPLCAPNKCILYLLFVGLKLPPCTYSHILITRQIGLYEQDKRMVWSQGWLCAWAYSRLLSSLPLLLTATASTAGPNGVHDQEIQAQVFHMHLPAASQISHSITTSLRERGKLGNTRDVQSSNIPVNGGFQNCLWACSCVCALLVYVQNATTFFLFLI